MPRWLRVIRGMIGTALVFAVGAGVVGTAIGIPAILLGRASWDDMRMVAKLGVVSFIIGLVFSGVLAIAARRRQFDKLSLRFVTTLGAGGGLLYFLFVAAMNGARVWTVLQATVNLALLTVMGAGAAAGVFIVARKAKSTLTSGESTPGLGEGAIEEPLVRRDAEHKADGGK